MDMSLEEEDSEENLKSVGPFGSTFGLKWDDGVHSTVRQLLIYPDHLGCLRCIQIEYDDNGVSYWSNRHGSRYIFKPYKVVLDYPYEYLTSISGYYFSTRVTLSYFTKITLRSNRRSYGPFGNDINPMSQYFSIEASGKKIVGFHGLTDYLILRAIGAYFKPIDHNDEILNHQAKPPLPPLLTLPSPKTTVPTKPDRRDEEPKVDVSGNETSGNIGDHNGSFVVGSTQIFIYQGEALSPTNSNRRPSTYGHRKELFK